MTVITNLGELGTVGGIRRPLDFTLQRDGAVWNLTGYAVGGFELRVWDVRTKTIVALAGTVLLEGAPTLGTVRYTPSNPTADLLYAASGVYEGRVFADPDDGGDKEPSGLFRFSIGDGPGPA